MQVRPLSGALMGKRHRRFVGKAEKKLGWRVWDTFLKRNWGPVFNYNPTQILDELNGERRGDEIARFLKKEQDDVKRRANLN